MSTAAAVDKLYQVLRIDGIDLAEFLFLALFGILFGWITISFWMAVFGAFVFTSMMLIQEFGLGLAAAVFLDATIIRVLLMPATMRLLGEWNWWFPKGLGKLIPQIHIKE